MQINLRDLAAKGQPVQLHEEIDISSLVKNRKDILHYGTAVADLKVICTAGTAEVSGSIKLELECSCSRCLTPVKETMDIPFRECFAEKTGGLEQQDQEEYDIHPAGEDNIDLSPYILENVMVSLPYAPLCKEACKGLCLNCGTNLNHQQCGCETAKIDPRLAGLADFFEK